MIAVTWNWYTRCPAYMCTLCQNFRPLPQAVQKLLWKVFVFDFFQDPCSFFPFKTIELCYYWVIRIHIGLKRPKSSIIAHFKTFFQDPCTRFNRTTQVNHTFDHFKTLVLVSFQHNGRLTARISTTQVWLACWRPATSIWLVERSDHTHVTCIQHQERYLVCNDYRLSR